MISSATGGEGREKAEVTDLKGHYHLPKLIFPLGRLGPGPEHPLWGGPAAAGRGSPLLEEPEGIPESIHLLGWACASHPLSLAGESCF